MTSSEDAVSGAVGGVLLIALVLIGAAIVGTYVASQPLPEKIPKVQFSVKQNGDTLYIVHGGGEPVDRGTVKVDVDGVKYQRSISDWRFGGDPIEIEVGNVNANSHISVSLVYAGTSGETLLRSVNSPDGFGYVFPAPDPSEVIDLPTPQPTPGPYGDLSWQFPATGDPQPTFAPINGKHVYVAAKDSTIIPPYPPLFVCNGVDDEREINDAIAMAQGGIVELLDGNFRCSGRITLPERTTLMGQGSLKTTVEITAKGGGSGYLPIAVSSEYVNIGGFTMRGNAFVMVTRSHARVQDVRATCIDLDGNWHTASGNGMFFVWVAPPVTVIDDVEFYECHVVNAHTHGFNMNQDYSDGVCRATTNIRFLNCRAVGCGYGVAGDPGITDSTVTSTNQSRSEWITGFDFHEWQDLVNCEVVNCVASDNWESGFHLEPGARYNDAGDEIGPRTVSKSVRFTDCTSSGNGQRNAYAGHFFMSGYYLSRNTTLTNCVSLNNRNAGFYVHAGENCDFTDCQDTGSTYGWKVCKASSDITLTDCISRENPRWALWLSFSQGIYVDNFQQYNIVGDRGYQNILGWYKDEAKYQQPVTDSEFHITAYGNGMPIINRAGSGNTYSLSYA
jgi:FlaG/FlaF family flagellin (archaellin)